MVDVVKKINFGTNTYAQVCNRVDPDYRGYTEFIIIDQCVCFPREGYDFRFTEEFQLVACRPVVRWRPRDRRLYSSRC
jgi:hypothetical protein